MNFVALPGTTGDALLAKIRGDGVAEVTNEASLDLDGRAAKRFDLRIRPGQDRTILFESTVGQYELANGNQATLWLLDDKGLVLVIAEAPDADIDAFRRLATSVVESVDLT